MWSTKVALPASWMPKQTTLNTFLPSTIQRQGRAIDYGTRGHRRIFSKHQLRKVWWVPLCPFLKRKKKWDPWEQQMHQAENLKKSSQWPHLKMLRGLAFAFSSTQDFQKWRHLPRIIWRSGDHFPPLFTSYHLLWNVHNKTLKDSNNPISILEKMG